MKPAMTKEEFIEWMDRIDEQLSHIDASSRAAFFAGISATMALVHATGIENFQELSDFLERELDLRLQSETGRN